MYKIYIPQKYNIFYKNVLVKCLVVVVELGEVGLGVGLAGFALKGAGVGAGVGAGAGVCIQ